MYLPMSEDHMIIATLIDNKNSLAQYPRILYPLLLALPIDKTISVIAYNNCKVYL